MHEGTKSQIETTLFADQLERSFRGGAWHGPALLEVLASVDAAVAACRPVHGAHSIWEIVHHLTVWLDIARRRAAGEAPRVDAEEDWSPTPAASATAWQETLNALETAHRLLLAAVVDLDDARLADPVPGSDPTLRGLLFGILQHNTYHAGQISVLIRAAAAGNVS